MNVFKKIIAVFLFAMSILSILTSCGIQDSNIYMFADLEECRTMAADELIQTHLTIYESPEQDKYIKELEYVDFFACAYSSDDLAFELFAYQFVETDAAKEYFSNVVGQQCAYDTDFLQSAGMSYYKCIVISDNMAYAVYSKRSDIDKLNELLGCWFTQEPAYSNGKWQLQPKGE